MKTAPILRIACLLGGLAAAPLSAAALPTIFPTPQLNKLSEERTKIEKIESRIRPAKSTAAIWKKIPAKEGAYAINISPSRLRIFAHDAAGLFYARQSLIQLLEGGDGRQLNAQSDPYAKKSIEQIFLGRTLPLGTLIDWADLPYRGTVEGYYGNPWGHVARKSQLRFYGRNKINTYIWAPKDDPYHHGWKCREAYPANVANEIKELCEVARENHVKFVWAIHPANTVNWSKEGGKPDLDALCAKLELMYELGVRHYGVFVDDSGGEILKASRQADLCNYITKNFIAKKDDVGPIIMCPTGYNRGWTNATWLSELGKTLLPETKVMWTGNTVVHDIKLEGQQWVKKALGRSTFIWWNWPCNDFARPHLVMGRTYGLHQDPEMINLMTGFVSNPMELAEASKTGIFGVGDYAWNIRGYDSNRNWKEGTKRLYPASADAVQTFVNHNSDPGPNNHGYRREESVAILPAIQALSKSLNEGKVNSKALQVLHKEFIKIKQAADTIAKGRDTAALAKDIKVWIDDFRILGALGERASISLAKDKPQLSELPELQELWTKWTKPIPAEVISSRPGLPHLPHQIKVETGAAHIAPLGKQMISALNDKFYREISGEKAGLSNPIFSSNKGEKLSSDALFDGNPSSYWDNGRLQKVGDFYMLDFGKTREIRSINLLMGGPRALDYIAAGQMEYSMNGKNWQPLGGIQRSAHIIMDLSKNPINAKQLRYRCIKTRPHWLAICTFDINKQLPAQARSNVKGWDNLSVGRNQKFVGINRNMELKRMKPGQGVSMNLPIPVQATWLEINFENAKLNQWAKVELTLEDGSKVIAKTHMEGNMLIAKSDVLPKKAISRVTLRNKSKKMQDVKMTMFKLDCLPLDPSKNTYMLRDKDLFSAYSLAKGIEQKLSIPEGAVEAIILSRHAPQLRVNNAASDAQGVIKLKLNPKSKSISLKSPAAKDGVIYEVIFR